MGCARGTSLTWQERARTVCDKSAGNLLVYWSSGQAPTGVAFKVGIRIGILSFPGFIIGIGIGFGLRLRIFQRQQNRTN